MGYFAKLFRKELRYPSLRPHHKHAMVLVKYNQQLAALQRETNRPLEVIPGQKRSFVLAGKPPRRFTLAWIELGTVVKMADLVREMNLAPAQLHKVANRIREAYAHCPDNEKFAARLGSGMVVFTPNDGLQKAIDAAVRESLASQTSFRTGAE